MYRLRFFDDYGSGWLWAGDTATLAAFDVGPLDDLMPLQPATRDEAAALSVATDRTALDSDGAVRASGPIGTLTAGALHIGQSGAGYVVVFKGGVSLIYEPGQ